MPLAGPVGSLTEADADAWRADESANDQAGLTAAYADVNGDGLDDIVAGCHNDDDAGPDAGAAYVLFGPVSGSASFATADAKLTGASPYDGVGNWAWGGRSRPLHGIGDVDDDGYEDVMLGARGDISHEGHVFLVHGPVSGTSSLGAAAATIQGWGSSSHFFGATNAAPADMNDDGVKDFILGDPYRDWASTNDGGVFVLYGLEP